MNIERVLELFENLELFLRMNGDTTILPSYSILNQTIEFLKSEEDEKEKKKFKRAI